MNPLSILKDQKIAPPTWKEIEKLMEQKMTNREIAEAIMFGEPSLEAVRNAITRALDDAEARVHAKYAGLVEAADTLCNLVDYEHGPQYSAPQAQVRQALAGLTEKGEYCDCDMSLSHHAKLIDDGRHIARGRPLRP